MPLPLSLCARLSFWYGLSYDDVRGMAHYAQQAYLAALPTLIAEYSQIFLSASAFPFLKPEAQRKLVASLHEHFPRATPQLSQEQFALALQARGIRFIPGGEQPSLN